MFLNGLLRGSLICTIVAILSLSSATLPVMASIDQYCPFPSETSEIFAPCENFNYPIEDRDIFDNNDEVKDAYRVGLCAFVYGLPWTYNTKAYQYVIEQAIEQAEEGVNEFVHDDYLKTADNHREGGSYNNDTLYSLAVIDLRDEPIILSIPDVEPIPSFREGEKERYYTMEMVDFRGDNFAYVGTRTTGSESGNYAIIGPNWHGDLPENVQEIENSHPSATPWALVGGRTLVAKYGDMEDEEDLTLVKALQGEYILTPLSEWGKSSTSGWLNRLLGNLRLTPLLQWGKSVTPSEIYDEHGLCVPHNSEDPLADWYNINCAMEINPPVPDTPELFELFETVGVGANASNDDLENQPESTKAGLARAASCGLQYITDPDTTKSVQVPVHGWRYPPNDVGRYSDSGNWLARAVFVQKGFFANDLEEAVYMNVSDDKDGELLNGDGNRYELQLRADEPDVNYDQGGFWSLTLYDGETSNMVANPIKRYSLGDRNEMDRDEEGNLTIYIQHDRPSICESDENCPNWLPAPAKRFYMILRAYLPGEDIIDRSWDPPAVIKVN